MVGSFSALPAPDAAASTPPPEHVLKAGRRNGKAEARGAMSGMRNRQAAAPGSRGSPGLFGRGRGVFPLKLSGTGKRRSGSVLSYPSEAFSGGRRSGEPSAAGRSLTPESAGSVGVRKRKGKRKRNARFRRKKARAAGNPAEGLGTGRKSSLQPGFFVPSQKKRPADRRKNTQERTWQNTGHCA